MQELVARLAFVAAFGLAVGLYGRLRRRYPRKEWQWGPIVVAAVMGGLAFYLSQQIARPHVPGLIDLPAFLIMVVAAGTMFVVFETAVISKHAGRPRPNGASAAADAENPEGKPN
jgi:drug/metabolite transporter (DMT)-like permease